MRQFFDEMKDRDLGENSEARTRRASVPLPPLHLFSLPATNSTFSDAIFSPFPSIRGNIRLTFFNANAALYVDMLISAQL